MAFGIIPIDSKVETIIHDKLCSLEPSFDFDGMDKMILRMCYKDFLSFMDYLKETKIKINNRNIIIDKFMIPSAEAISNLYNMKMCDDTDVKDVMDDGKFVENWTEWWFKKYKSRVKLVLGTLPPMASNASKGVDHLSKFTPEEITDMKKIIKFRFIEGGEICGSMVLTEVLFTRILNQYSEKFEWNVSTKLHLLNAMLKEVNKLIHTYGILIFIKPTKESYQLKEYREDLGTTTIK